MSSLNNSIESNLGNRGEVFDKTHLPKTGSQNSLYSSGIVVGSGDSLKSLSGPVMVSSDDLYFLGSQCLIPEDEEPSSQQESFEFPTKFSSNNSHLFPFYSNGFKKSFEESVSIEDDIGTKANNSNLKTISQPQFENQPSNKALKTKKCQSPSNSQEFKWIHSSSEPKSILGKPFSQNSFPTKKKGRTKRLRSFFSPTLNLVHDTTTTLTQEFIKISFMDLNTKQSLLVRIRCRNNKKEISEEELKDLILSEEIQINSDLGFNNKKNITITAYSEKLKDMHISMIYPASKQDILEHKESTIIQIKSRPSDEYTEYREHQNKLDLKKGWIGRILSRDPSEDRNFISEISVNNGDGRIILVSPLSSKKNKIICFVDYFSETIYSLRDLQSKHVIFLERMRECIEKEIQNNDQLVSYRNCPVYIETEYPSKIHCLHFNISTTRHKSNFELSEIIEKLRENNNYWKDVVLEVSLSSLDPRIELYKKNSPVTF